MQICLEHNLAGLRLKSKPTGQTSKALVPLLTLSVSPLTRLPPHAPPNIITPKSLNAPWCASTLRSLLVLFFQHETVFLFPTWLTQTLPVSLSFHVIFFRKLLWPPRDSIPKVTLQHILGYYCSSPTSISGSSLPQQDCILFTLIFLRPDIHQTLPVDKNILEISITLKGFPWWLSGKESSCQCRRHGFNSWVGKIPWRVKWQPTPVFLPEKFHAQRSLWGLQSIASQRVRHDIATKWQQITLREASAFLSLELFLAVSKMLTHVFPWFPFSFFSSHNPPSCLSNPY